MRSILFSYFVLSALLISCKNTTTKIISDYEMQNNQIKIINVKSIGTFIEFYAKDSAIILSKMYDSLYKEKMLSLNIQLQATNNELTKAQKELLTITNPLMYNAYNIAVSNIALRKTRIEKIICIYKNNIKQTGFNSSIKKVKFYNKNANLVLGYTLPVLFIGNEGQLQNVTFSKVYLFNNQKNKIIGANMQNDRTTNAGRN